MSKHIHINGNHAYRKPPLGPFGWSIVGGALLGAVLGAGLGIYPMRQDAAYIIKSFSSSPVGQPTCRTVKTQPPSVVVSLTETHQDQAEAPAKKKKMRYCEETKPKKNEATRTNG